MAGCDYDQCSECFHKTPIIDETVWLHDSMAAADAGDKPAVTVPLVYELLQRVPLSLLR